MKNVVYRAVLIGDCAVGKTSIINRLVNNTFEDHLQSTIGESSFLCQIKSVDTVYQMRFNDINGQLDYISSMPICFRNCALAIAVFDFTNESSLNNLKCWIQKFRDCNDEMSQIIVVGNKSDLESCISEKQINIKLDDININYSNYISISTKTGANFSDLLTAICNSIDKYETKPIDLDVDNKKKTEPIYDRNKCCNIF